MPQSMAQRYMQRYVPRWVIEVGLVVAAVQIYRKTAGMRDQFLKQPFVVALSQRTTNRTKRVVYWLLSLGVFAAAVWRWWVLRKRLLQQQDGPLDQARIAATSAGSAVDAAAQHVAEVVEHASSTDRELAACRLALAELQQALRGAEQQQRKLELQLRSGLQASTAQRTSSQDLVCLPGAASFTDLQGWLMLRDGPECAPAQYWCSLSRADRHIECRSSEADVGNPSCTIALDGALIKEWLSAELPAEINIQVTRMQPGCTHPCFCSTSPVL